jgi:Cu+-exporting ATPase
MRILQALAMTALIGLAVPAIAQNKTAPAKKPVAKTAAVTCTVSGKTIKDTAKAVKHTYNKKTYYFCCTGCLSKFKTTPTAYINKKVATTASNKTASCCEGEAAGACCDAEKAAIATAKTEEISKDMLYCPVMEEEIADVKKALPIEYEGKTYYLCCTDCKKSFVKNPEKYIKRLEEWQKAQKAEKTQ